MHFREADVRVNRNKQKISENNITTAPHRCYGRLPITRQLRKACPRLYRGQFRCRWMRHPICISTGASVGFHFRCRWMRHPICISTGASVGLNFRCRCQNLSGESKMFGASNFFLRLFISFYFESRRSCRS